MAVNEIYFNNLSSDEDADNKICDYVKIDITHSDFSLRIPEVKIRIESTI